MLRCFVLAAACGLAAANAVRFAYLPPPDKNNTSAVSLAERFGAYQDSEALDISFQPDDGVTSLWQRHVDRIIARGVAQLALQLDRAIAPSEARDAQAVPDNCVFSPLSVASALALVLLGAGGQTFLEVARVLGLATGVQLADKSSVVHEQFGRLLSGFAERPGMPMATQAVTANAIFVQDHYPIRERFRRVSKEAYESDVLSLDFSGHRTESRDTINAWIEKKTHGRIKNFLATPPEPDTRVIIASALYFNGEWEYPFPVETTAKRPFYVSDNEVLEVAMMANSAELPYHESAALGCRVLGLPYKGGEVVMYLVLPNKPGYEALQELQDRLTVQALEELVASVKEESVIVLLPRMKLEASINLRDALQYLGVTSLFDPQRANLSLISPGVQAQTPNEVKHLPTSDGMLFRERRQLSNPGLYADEVLHKVEVEVTETGTVASAVTLVSVTRDGSRRNFRVDRPFLFFIRHRSTGLVLFWGSVVRPTPSTAKAPTKTRTKTG